MLRFTGYVSKDDSHYIPLLTFCPELHVSKAPETRLLCCVPLRPLANTIESFIEEHHGFKEKKRAEESNRPPRRDGMSPKMMQYWGKPTRLLQFVVSSTDIGRIQIRDSQHNTTAVGRDVKRLHRESG
jgi:hypothetical protein